MKWYGASQRRGTLSRLEPHGKDVKAVTLYTHTFYLLDEGRVAEQKLPFYTATAATPQEAEELAFTVYQRARDCLHDMQRKAPNLIECRHCGLQRVLAPAPLSSTQPPRKPERRFFNLF